MALYGVDIGIVTFERAICSLYIYQILACFKCQLSYKRNGLSRFYTCEASLTTTIPRMKGLILSLDEAGLHGQVRVMVGGAPITESYTMDIGADLYAPDAASAASRAKELIAELGKH